MIRVYTTENCSQCRMTKKWLDDRGIPYEVVNLQDSPQDMEAVLAMGYTSAPVVFTETTHWSGFRPDLLEVHAKGAAA